MGIECAHIFVTKAEPCHHAWTELFDEDIGALNELGQFRAVHLVLEIEVHTDLAAIEHDESRAFAVDHRRKTPRILASGCSILITSAPASASIKVASGPGS